MPLAGLFCGALYVVAGYVGYREALQWYQGMPLAPSIISPKIPSASGFPESLRALWVSGYGASLAETLRSLSMSHVLSILTFIVPFIVQWIGFSKHSRAPHFVTCGLHIIYHIRHGLYWDAGRPVAFCVLGGICSWAYSLMWPGEKPADPHALAEAPAAVVAKALAKAPASQVATDAELAASLHCTEHLKQLVTWRQQLKTQANGNRMEGVMIVNDLMKKSFCKENVLTSFAECSKTMPANMAAVLSNEKRDWLEIVDTVVLPKLFEKRDAFKAALQLACPPN